MYISIAVIAVLTIAFLVFLYRARARWHWAHLTLLFLVYCTAIFGGLMISRSFKVHNAWKQAYVNLEARYEKAVRDAEEIQFGPRDSIVPGPQTVAGITRELQNELLGRGRVWQNVSVQLNGENYVVSLPTTPPAEGAAAPAAPAATDNQMSEGKVLFAFLEQPVRGIEGATSGVEFLGTFSVLSATGTQATLQPILTVAQQNRRTLVLDPTSGQPQLDANGKPQVAMQLIFPELAAELNTPSGRWSLYETMPPDMRDTFKNVGAIDVNPQDENVNFDDYQTQYRAVLEEYMPPAKFGLLLEDPAQAVIYEQIIDRYAFDMMRLSDINEWISRHSDTRRVTTFSPVLEERLARLKFTDRSQEFELDTEAGTVKDPGIFDGQGRAVLNELKVGGKFRIEKDGVLIVDTETAARLQSEGNQFVNEGEVFVRRLQDFAVLESTYTAQLEDVFSSMLALQNELAVLRATDADLQMQERQRTTYYDQLARRRKCDEGLGGDFSATGPTPNGSVRAEGADQ